MISLVNCKKRFVLVIVLALTMAFLLAPPAMAAERTNLFIASPLIGENQTNMVTAGSNVTFVSAVPNVVGAMYTFWVNGPDGCSLAQESASNEYTLYNAQPGTYTVDVYIWNATNRALAEARQVILVDSSAVFTENSYKDGKITLTAQAENISGDPLYQFWYKDSEGWKCPLEPASFDYNTRNTVSFEATAGKTYEVAVYAKDKNADGSWKQAAAASKTILALEEINVNESNKGDILNLQAGQTIKLSLSENPSTGFLWQYKSMFDTNILEEVASYVLTPAVSEGLVGAPVERIWIYKALNTGDTTIDLWYIRPWLYEPEPADTFTLGIKVIPSTEEAFSKTKTTAQTEIQKYITTGKANSASVAVMDGGELIYTKGFGIANREKNIPADSNTVFNIGSVSKMFVATSIMLLVDEGKVALDKPVTSYLPEFTMADERYKDITVRMLLNHSSGLPGSTFWNNIGSEYNQNIYPELLATLSQSTLKHRPGELAPYCNDGFTLAEMIVAKVTGKSFGDFLSERIFQPLALDHTGLGVGRLPEGMTPAKFYRPDGKSEPLEILSMIASGGISSTTENLCRFADIFSGVPAILSTQSLTEMQKVLPSELQGKLLGNTDPFGLGWDFADLSPFSAKDLRLYGKSGGTGHYNSMLFTVPSQRITVAVIACGPECSTPLIAYKIISAYLEEKGLISPEEKEVKKPVEAQTITPELMVYGGYYCAGGEPLRIDLDDKKGRLDVVDVGKESVLFSATHNNGFFYDGENKYYFITVDGTRYFMEFSSLFDFHKISAEELPPLAHPLQLSIPMDGKVWLQRNVKATGVTNTQPFHVMSSSLIPNLPGYMHFDGTKIVKSTDYAGMPVKSIRDLTELKLFERNGATWVWLSGADYMPAELAVSLDAGTNTITIGSEGYNEWLKVEFDTNLRFEAPATGRVIVFGPENENVLYDSVISCGEVFVPKDSLIEFAGAPGDSFTVIR